MALSSITFNVHATYDIHQRPLSELSANQARAFSAAGIAATSYGPPGGIRSMLAWDSTLQGLATLLGGEDETQDALLRPDTLRLIIDYLTRCHPGCDDLRFAHGLLADAAQRAPPSPARSTGSPAAPRGPYKERSRDNMLGHPRVSAPSSMASDGDGGRAPVYAAPPIPPAGGPGGLFTGGSPQQLCPCYGYLPPPQGGGHAMALPFAAGVHGAFAHVSPPPPPAGWSGGPQAVDSISRPHLGLNPHQWADLRSVPPAGTIVPPLGAVDTIGRAGGTTGPPLGTVDSISRPHLGPNPHGGVLQRLDTSQSPLPSSLGDLRAMATVGSTGSTGRASVSALGASHRMAPHRLAERDLESAAKNAQSQALAIAALEETRHAYPAIRRALLLRLTGRTDATPIPTDLPFQALVALAHAQHAQDTGFVVACNSARAGAAEAGRLGVLLNDTLSNPATFDIAAAHLIADTSFPVELHVLEILGGVTPLIALATELTVQHYHAVRSSVGPTLLQAALDASFVSSKGVLDLVGITGFLNVYYEATRRSQRFLPGPIYRALISRIAGCSEHTAERGPVSWRADCLDILERFHARIPELDDGPPVTHDELRLLVEWLREWQFNLAMLASIKSTGATAFEGSSPLEVRAAKLSHSDYFPQPEVDNAPPLTVLLATRRLKARELHTLAQLGYLRGIKPSQCRRRRGTHPCWSADCPANTRPSWAVCSTCCTLSPLAATCLTPGCSCPPFASGLCPGGCGVGHSSASLLQRSTDSALLAAATMIALNRHPFPSALMAPGHAAPPLWPAPPASAATAPASPPAVVQPSSIQSREPPTLGPRAVASASTDTRRPVLPAFAGTYRPVLRPGEVDHAADYYGYCAFPQVSHAALTPGPAPGTTATPWSLGEVRAQQSILSRHTSKLSRIAKAAGRRRAKLTASRLRRAKPRRAASANPACTAGAGPRPPRSLPLPTRNPLAPS